MFFFHNFWLFLPHFGFISLVQTVPLLDNPIHALSVCRPMTIYSHKHVCHFCHFHTSRDIILKKYTCQSTNVNLSTKLQVIVIISTYPNKIAFKCGVWHFCHFHTNQDIVADITHDNLSTNHKVILISSTWECYFATLICFLETGSKKCT